MKNFLSTLYLLVFCIHCFGQASVRKLPTSINHPAINVSNPYMSFDGDALVFLSDNSEDYLLTPFFTFRAINGDWREPAALPRLVYNKLCYLRGYALDPDGKTLYFSTIKSPGVGGYDLWTSKRRGASWGAPENIGYPINTRGNEACATLTPDGKTIYFMRCDKMNQEGASQCTLWIARKQANGKWGEPEALPDYINTGNSQTPRIMADGETLIFSSDQFKGNKGGMDLYLSRYLDGQWTQPQPLDFVNTERDDQYVSVNGLGRYLLRDSPGTRKSELVEYLIPKQLRPKGVMRIDGVVTAADGGKALAYLSVIDLSNGKRVFSGRPMADGSFTIFLQEGSRYELAINPEKGNVSFYSQSFDLTTEDIPQFTKIKATLKPITSGDEISLDQVSFKPNSAMLTQSSNEELKRVARLIKGNPNLKFELQVMLIGYHEDSIRSGPDLTEVTYDSAKIMIDDIDSLGQKYQRDSITVRTVYHNDQTQKQANTIIDFLNTEGIPREQITIFVNARPEALEEKRKVFVKIRVL